LICIDNSF